MMNKYLMKRGMMIILVLLLLLTFVPLPTISADESSSDWYDVSEFRDTTYYRTLQNWLKTYQIISNVNHEFKVEDNKAANLDSDIYYNNELSKDIVNLSKEESFTYTVKIEKSGLYYLSLDYFYDYDFTANPTIDILINGNIEYNESEDLNLSVIWDSVEREEENKYNRYNDELLPYSVPKKIWYHSSLTDCFSEDTNKAVFYLEDGVNTVTIVSHQDNFKLGSLYIDKEEKLKNYKNYIEQYTDITYTNSNIVIQGESFTSKNDIEIKAGFYKSYKMTPKSFKSQVLNTISGGSMGRSGTSVTYSFEVPEDGLYQLSFKYKQNTLAGLAVGKSIYIDDKIPFEELEDYLFPYTKSWVNYTLNDNKNPYKFYLTKGNHTITIKSTASHTVDAIDELYKVMDAINSIGITINTITGSSSNTQITWKITDYLPTLEDELNDYADTLETIYDYINSLNPSTKEASEVSTLIVAAKQLRRLSKHPNKIQNKLAELSEGSGSAYQLIGTAIGYLINQSMDFDYFVFSNDSYKMDKPNGNIFGRLWFGLESFIYSFFDKRYNIENNLGMDTIDVLISASSLYTNIIQELVDDEFTRNTGIKVRINILSNTQSLILNNATGNNPDLVLELDSWLPYTYALRGMLANLKEMKDFDQVTKDIYSSNFTPLIYENGVYGIPETQGMQLLFYRSDILNALGLTAPSTWDEVLKMLPTLQSYQMNFYHPLGADSAYKGFGVTSQFFYLFGSEMYTENGFDSNLSNESSVEAIQYMTDLFNIYNLPQQVSSFFEHFRSGTLPIGIGSVDLYLQLKYACPELSGQWGVLPIPGFLSEETNEVERWTTTYGKCSIMLESSIKKEKAWEFLKWWHQASTQLEYVQTIKMNLGERYLIVPANMETLMASPWDLEIKQEVVSAAKWSRIPAITPGSYIVEREISNIWNSCVIDKKPVRVAINQSIPKINRELHRKFEEFNYLKNGEIIKEYIVPTNKNISQWVKGKEYYE